MVLSNCMIYFVVQELKRKKHDSTINNNLFNDFGYGNYVCHWSQD